MGARSSGLSEIEAREVDGDEQPMTHDRKMGRADSSVRAAILDATERLVGQHGYATVTARRLALESGSSTSTSTVTSALWTMSW
jgi:hypothetical protein